MNYLASPPLVVAYALAGTMDIDLTTEPLGHGLRRQAGVPARHLARRPRRSPRSSHSSIGQRDVQRDYADVFAGDEHWRSLPTPTGDTFEWDPRLDLRAQAPVLRGHAAGAGAGHRHRRRPGAGQARRLGHHRPHLARPARSRPTPRPAQYLPEHGVDGKDFNSYGSRRGNHEVMIRGTFANIRLRNQLAPGTEGGFTRDFTADGEPVSAIYDASANYQAAGMPLVVLAGKEYGSGSSRDWAAKGTALLGVRAVIAESYERIHRSNLIGMGVLPLQFPEGETAESLGPDRRGDVHDHRGRRRSTRAASRATVTRHGRRRRGVRRGACASTPPARPTTTATAASCSTSCARCSPSPDRASRRPGPTLRP